MSYLVSNYYQNPPPPYGALYGPGTTESFDTVPGWGIQPWAAGPERVGIGASMIGGSQAQLTALVEQQKAEATGATGFPWWGYVVGAAALGAGLAVAVKKGWI